MRAAIIALLPVGLAGCAPAPEGEGAGAPTYLGIAATPLAPDLVSLRVEMEGTRDRAALLRYADCAAAGHAAARGDGFVRHLRTTVSETAGIFGADAVYTISPGLPRGLMTIDAEATVADCAAAGVPTV